VHSNLHSPILVIAASGAAVSTKSKAVKAKGPKARLSLLDW